MKMSNYSLYVLIIFFFTLLNVQGSESANLCKAKLIPKRDLRIILLGVKYKWATIDNVSTYGECVTKAENILKKVNGPFKAESIVDVFAKVFLSVFEPEYYKAIKVSYLNEAGQKHRTKIKYKKK